MGQSLSERVVVLEVEDKHFKKNIKQISIKLSWLIGIFITFMGTVTALFINQNNTNSKQHIDIYRELKLISSTKLVIDSNVIVTKDKYGH